VTSARTASFEHGRLLFLRGLGLVYAVAFCSLAVQLPGLIGDDGILPAGRFLAAVTRSPFATWWDVPSIVWWTGGDTSSLQCIAWLGAAAGTLLFLGILPMFAAAAAWTSYLSLVSVGQVFLGFQWDALLLEAGLLGILLAPSGVRLGGDCRPAPRAFIWLCWLLVGKLHLSSGLAKLMSGDPTWRDLTALDYHYWTTCLPTWTGWWMQQLPPIVHRGTTALVLFVELVAPVCIFCGRRLRHLAGLTLIGLQIGIAATGNYGFFNLLTIVLCFTLYHDEAFVVGADRRPSSPSAPARARQMLAVALAIPIAALSLTPMMNAFVGSRWLPAPLVDAWRVTAPFRTFNGYGLFSSMTTVRPEIVVEATFDGDTWEPYEFRWKPGDVTRRPAFVQPHMPRLDWQMWFAALQGPERARWFVSFLHRLADADSDVVALLARAPGTGRPYAVRARLYRYEFTDLATRRRTGAWWQRRLVGAYAAPVRSAG